MLKPSSFRNSVLAATASLLLSSGVMAKPKTPATSPVPPVPTEVREKGGDAVLDWLLDNNFLTPADLCAHTAQKVCDATDVAEENPLLNKLHSDFNALPATAFKVGMKPTWEKIAVKLTPDVLAKANSLESPRIYGVNGEGQLLIGDGGNEVPSFTLRQDYPTVRNAAKTHGLSLMTEGEYRAFNNGAMELRTVTWLESGDAPTGALGGYWDVGLLRVGRYGPQDSRDGLGARRVLRVK
ncbi:hypothetical protein HYW83_00940 [Candidatus Peregrinibacteria bacterium]|nr:hypothetical protein [Candidatus Peregrinibacteria bacterium]